MTRTKLGFRFRWFLLTLFLANNIKTTHNQYYYIQGKRPVFIIDESMQSPVRSSESDSQTSSEINLFSARSLEDFGSSETAEVQYIHTDPEDHPDLEKSPGGARDSFTFSHESVDSVESANLNPKSTSQESLETTNLKGDPGFLFEHDEEGRLPEPRLFFKGWPLRIEYKESWKGRRQEIKPKPQHPYVRPTSLVDPKFYDSKFYYKYVKKRNKKIKKAKKWQKLSSLIQFKYMKYLKELEQLAPDDASIYDSDSVDDGRKLKKSKSKKKKQKKKYQ